MDACSRIATGRAAGAEPPTEKTAEAAPPSVESMTSPTNRALLAGLKPGELCVKRKRASDEAPAYWRILSLTDSDGAALLQVAQGIESENLARITISAVDLLKEWKVSSVKVPTAVLGWGSWSQGSVWKWMELKAEVALYMLYSSFSFSQKALAWFMLHVCF